jgi:hypothetical protein
MQPFGDELDIVFGQCHAWSWPGEGGWVKRVMRKYD